MDFLRDVRLIVRDLVRQRGYTLAAVTTLAVAIGANSAIFGAVHAVLLRPSAVSEPRNLVIIWERDPAGRPVVELSYRNFQDWVGHSRSLRQAAAVGSSTWPVVLDGRGESVRLSSAGVSASFFDTLGAVPALGRGFRPDDDVPNAPRVVVLSHNTWTRWFGGDPGVVGRPMEIGRPHTIVGVMPEGFDFPHGADIWLPVVPILAVAGGGRLQSPLESVGVLFVVGRLHHGVTPGMAAEELDRIAARLERSGGAHRFGKAVVVTPFLDYAIGPVRSALWLLFAAVGLLLLIACANVSGLMLTRVSLRRREQAIRFALGASRKHLVGHWVIETLILSAVGGGLGLAISRWISQAVVALAPEVPRLSEISVNSAVAGFTFAAVLATALLCGVQPVRHAGSSRLFEALNDAGRATPGRRSIRARSLLLGFQVSLTVVLLVSAGLVARGFVNLRTLDLGFVPANVLTMNVGPRDPRPSANEWMHALLARATALPDVVAAGAVSVRPLALGAIGAETWVILEGQPDAPASRRANPGLNYQVATPGYFRAMGIQLRRGRLFSERDDASSPKVALVGESTARQLWRGRDPIGQRILMPAHTADGGPGIWRTVVGVVSDVRYRGIDDVRLDVYDAALQSPVTAADVVVRTSGDPLQLAAAVQAEARRLDPRVVIDRLTTMDLVVARAVAPWRFSAWLFTSFAGLAFVLAAVGLFSLVSLDVAQRGHEFAIRLALGAQLREIRTSVVRSAVHRVVPALILGVLAAVATNRVIRHVVFQVDPLDPVTYLAVIALILAVVIAATWLPAHRAATADPVTLLRRE